MCNDTVQGCTNAGARAAHVYVPAVTVDVLLVVREVLFCIAPLFYGRGSLYTVFVSGKFHRRSEVYWDVVILCGVKCVLFAFETKG